MEGLPYSEKFHPIGLQCFRRPGLQAAFGLEAEKGEDFSPKGWRVYFRQNVLASQRIHINFHFDPEKKCILTNSWLFPEEEIAEVANKVKKSKTFSKQTVKDFCKTTGRTYESVVTLIEAKGMSVANTPSYVLSTDRVLELTKEYSDRPYGDIRLSTRLCCKPKGDISQI